MVGAVSSIPTVGNFIEFSLNCQQHKVDRSGNYFFPVFLSIKFVKATEKFYMLQNFLINDRYQKN